MQSLDDYIQPAEVLEMPVDVLALRMLPYVVQVADTDGQLTRWTVANSNQTEAVRQLMIAAWDWLFTHGLITSADPASHKVYVTRLGLP